VAFVLFLCLVKLIYIAVKQCSNKLNCGNRLVRLNLQSGCQIIGVVLLIGILVLGRRLFATPLCFFEKEVGVKMKILFFLLMVSNLAFGQIDTTNWYPLDIGNKWQFSYGIDPEDYSSKEVIGDTTMPNGKTYAIVKNGSNTKYQRNHNNQYVYSYNQSDSSEYVLYDFISSDSTFWEYPFENFFWGIQVTKNEYNYFLNKSTRYKYYDWVKIDSSNNFIDTIWNSMIDIYPTRIAQGIGVTNYNYSNYPGSGGLIGVIINGDTLGVLTNISENKNMVNNYYLYQNYPNPFNPTTEIGYILLERSFVTLSVYNVLGEKVSTLVSETKVAGKYNVKFNAENLSSGIYFYNISVNDFSQTKKMILLR
jgi:type IX secretion system substrate protein